MTEQVRKPSTLRVDQVAAVLDMMAGTEIDYRCRHARALGFAEVMLQQALFGTATEWQMVRNMLLDKAIELEVRDAA